MQNKSFSLYIMFQSNTFHPHTVGPPTSPVQTLYFEADQTLFLTLLKMPLLSCWNLGKEMAWESLC